MGEPFLAHFGFVTKILVSGQTKNPFEFEFDYNKKISNVDFYACVKSTGGSEYSFRLEPDVEDSICDTVDIYFLPVKRHVDEPALPGEEEEIQSNFKPVSNEWMRDLDKYLVPDSSEPVLKSNLLNDIVRN